MASIAVALSIQAGHFSIVKKSFDKHVSTSGAVGVTFKLWRVTGVDKFQLIPGHVQKSLNGDQWSRGFEDFVVRKIPAHMQNRVDGTMV